MRPKKYGKTYARDIRAGLYVMPETRHRLNLVKAQLEVRYNKSHSQDDAINYLIDQYAADNQILDEADHETA